MKLQKMKVHVHSVLSSNRSEWGFLLSFGNWINEAVSVIMRLPEKMAQHVVMHDCWQENIIYQAQSQIVNLQLWEINYYTN